MPIPPNLCSCGILYPVGGVCPKCPPKATDDRAMRDILRAGGLSKAGLDLFDEVVADLNKKK